MVTCTRNYIPRPPYAATCDCPYCAPPEPEEAADDER